MAGTLSTALGWTGCEKFLIPLLNPLLVRLVRPRGFNSAAAHTLTTSVNKPAARELLETILSSPETPASVIKELAGILIELPTSESDIENKGQLRKLLAQLRQRYPEIFSEVLLGVISEKGEEGRTEIEQLILSLSVVSAVTVPNEYSLMPLPPDEPGFHTVDRDGGQSHRPHNGIGRLGSKYTHGGSAGSFGEEQR